MTATGEISEKQARQVAEHARAAEWLQPSFGKELFLGRLRLDLVHPHPTGSAEATERGEAFLATLREFCESQVDAAVIERDAQIPDAVIMGLKELGALGMKIPTEYGGLGLSQVYYNKALGLVCSLHPALGALLSAHQSIGVPQPISMFGTEEQKQTWLPRCAREVSAFLLTEPDVGSDPARLHTTATPDGDDYVLDGLKLWTTNGVTRFTNVRVPAANRIGEEGDGLRIALSTLNVGRLSLPAACCGTAKWCLKIAREWSKERVQWGRPVGEHDAVAGKVAFIAATAYGLEAMVALASELADAGHTDIRIEAALAKLYGSEMTWLIADELVQIRGGRGFETAESLAARGERGVPAEQVRRDMRINRIFEGSTEIMHLLIAREAVDVHLSVAGDIIDPQADMRRKARAAANAGRFYARWLPTLLTGKGQLPTSFGEFGPLGAHLRYVERASRRLARSTFYAMSRWQGKLEHKQRFLGRIVDIGAELFAMTAACVRAQRDRTDEAAVELADAFCRQARVRADQLFDTLWRNADDSDRTLAHKVLDGRYTWLEAGILDPSIEGPWIAQDGGASKSDVHRVIRD